MTTYYVGCEYIDDGIENDDPVVAEFSTMSTAQQYADELSSQADVIKVYITTSDSPL